jgi:hypothetical protein
MVILYGYFGARSSYDLEPLLFEQYLLNSDYIEVSSSAPMSNVGNRITRVFEVHVDGKWNSVDLTEYQSIVEAYDMKTQELGQLTFGSSEPITGTSKVSSNNTNKGQFNYPIQLSSKFVSTEDSKNMTLSLFKYRSYEHIESSVYLESSIIFDADREETIKFFFKPFVKYEFVASDVLFSLPAYSRVNVIGYIEVRSN